METTDEALIWAWGTNIKSRAGWAEAERVMGVQPHELHFGLDIARSASERLRARLATAPMRTLYFGARTAATMLGGIVTRCREHGVRPRKIVLEDHGLPGLLFLGCDAITMRTLPSYRRNFEILRECVVPETEIFLLHCQAFADGGVLAREMSAIVGCPIYGGVLDQIANNQTFEGPVLRATAREVVCVDERSIDEAILHFD